VDPTIRVKYIIRRGTEQTLKRNNNSNNDKTKQIIYKSHTISDIIIIIIIIIIITMLYAISYSCTAMRNAQYYDDDESKINNHIIF